MPNNESDPCAKGVVDASQGSVTLSQAQETIGKIYRQMIKDRAEIKAAGDPVALQRYDSTVGANLSKLVKNSYESSANAARNAILNNAKFESRKAEIDTGSPNKLYNATKMLSRAAADKEIYPREAEAKARMAMRQKSQEMGLPHSSLEKYFESGKNDQAIMDAHTVTGKEADPRAKAVREILDSSFNEGRLRANRNGATIGQLDNYTGKTIHGPEKVRYAGFGDMNALEKTKNALAGGNQDVNFEAYKKDFIKHYDLDKSLPGLQGPDLDGAIKQHYESAITGVHPIVPEQETGLTFKGNGSIASRLSQSRKFFFKSTADELAYRQKYGYGRGTLAEGFFNQIKDMAKKNALMEHFGTSPENTWKNLQDHVRNEYSSSDKKDVELRKQTGKRGYLDNVFHDISGALNTPVSRGIDNIEKILLGKTALDKTGSAIFPHFGNIATAAAELGDRGQGVAERFIGKNGFFNSWKQGWQNTLSDVRDFFTKTDNYDPKEYSRITMAMSLAHKGYADSMYGTGDIVGGVKGVLRKMSDLQFYASGLQGMLNHIRNGVQVGMSNYYGSFHETPFDDLHPDMKRNLQENGIGRAAWNATRKTVQPTDKGSTFINMFRARNEIPDADIAKIIQERSPVSQELADLRAKEELSSKETNRKATLEGQELAKISPNNLLRERDALHSNWSRIFEESADRGLGTPDVMTRRGAFPGLGGTQAGTPSHLLAASLAQFHLIPLRLTKVLLDGAKEDPSMGLWDSIAQNKINYVNTGVRIASTMVAGGLAEALNDMAMNRKPESLSHPQAWFKAIAKGSGMGFYADVLFEEAAKDRPDDKLGIAANLLPPSISSVGKAAYIGEEALRGKKVASNLIDYLKYNTPGSSFWPTKGLMDTYVWRALHEWANPGYNQRQARAMQKQGRQPFIVPSSPTQNNAGQ